MYCLELITFDVSSYYNKCNYVEVENGALWRDVARSWKMILGGHVKSRKIFREKLWEPQILQTIGTRKIISEMTYNVSMGTLNPTIPYLLESECCYKFTGSHSLLTVMLK